MSRPLPPYCALAPAGAYGQAHRQWDELYRGAILDGPWMQACQSDMAGVLSRRTASGRVAPVLNEQTMQCTASGRMAPTPNEQAVRRLPPVLAAARLATHSDRTAANANVTNYDRVWRTLRAEAARQGKEDAVQFAKELIDNYHRAGGDISVISGEQMVVKLREVARERNKAVADSLTSALEDAACDKRALKGARNVEELKRNLSRVVAVLRAELDRVEESDGCCDCCGGGKPKATRLQGAHSAKKSSAKIAPASDTRQPGMDRQNTETILRLQQQMLQQQQLLDELMHKQASEKRLMSQAAGVTTTPLAPAGSPPSRLLDGLLTSPQVSPRPRG